MNDIAVSGPTGFGTVIAVCLCGKDGIGTCTCRMWFGLSISLVQASHVDNILPMKRCHDNNQIP